MQTFTTPMMKQYMDIKSHYRDCLLLYRMGDFYELFLEDAHIGAQVLNITLTSRPKGKDGRIPMAGVPYHAIDAYIAKLVRSGYKVAICEQLSPPNTRGIIKRAVIRIVTPGTVLDEKVLDKKENNYIISLLIKSNTVAIAAADVSTGFFGVTELPFDNLKQTLTDELAMLQPAECIVPEELYNDPELLAQLHVQKHMNIYRYNQWETFADKAKSFLSDHFGVHTLAAFGVDDKHVALQAAAALLGYLQYTQKDTLPHIKKITDMQNDTFVVMDRSTMVNLELFATLRDHDTQATLLSVLDHTLTAMGGRLLKEWVKKPLIDKKLIMVRHQAVGELIKNHHLQQNVREELEHITDIERIVSRLSVGIGNVRDINNIKMALQHITRVKRQLQTTTSDLLLNVQKNIEPHIETIISLIEKTFVDEPPIDVKNGGMIRNGVNRELDSLHKTIDGGKEWLMMFEKQEKERTGIASLKVRFNQVFGFYIELSKANMHLAPKEYFRKQTLVNGERFTTKELKEHEAIILTAEEKMHELEYQIFIQTLGNILKEISVLQKAAQAIATLDCVSNFAYIAQKNNYVEPKLLYSGEIKIIQGRHPVVENLLPTKEFVPNDTVLDNTNQQLLIITGPNMAGKSVLIRQVALIVLMNQVGSFVPAEKAYLSLVDRIFVRSGASDVIASGLSTFMVEMVETAHILHHATDRSLIIMDEIGRGTSTYDGISIAWSVAQYLVTALSKSPKTLFATHYHELQALEKEYPAIKNFHMGVTDNNGQPVFLHTLLPGGASHSFGVAVAKLAGIPEEVIKHAQEMLRVLEKRNAKPEQSGNETMGQSRTTQKNSQATLIIHLLQKELENLDIVNMTPLEAMNTLANLKEQLKMITDKTTKEFLEAD